MVVDSITLQDYEKAEGELQAREGRVSFVIHAAIYALVNILLIVLNLVYVPEILWFFFPLIGWGIGLTMHYLFAVRFAKQATADWQARVEYRARQMRARQASAF